MNVSCSSREFLRKWDANLPNRHLFDELHDLFMNGTKSYRCLLVSMMAAKTSKVVLARPYYHGAERETLGGLLNR